MLLVDELSFKLSCTGVTVQDVRCNGPS